VSIASAQARGEQEIKPDILRSMLQTADGVKKVHSQFVIIQARSTASRIASLLFQMRIGTQETLDRWLNRRRQSRSCVRLMCPLALYLVPTKTGCARRSRARQATCFPGGTRPAVTLGFSRVRALSTLASSERYGGSLRVPLYPRR